MQYCMRIYCTCIEFLIDSISTKDLAHAVRYSQEKIRGDQSSLIKKVDALVARVRRSVLVSLHPYTDSLSSHSQHQHHHRSISISNSNSHSHSGSNNDSRSSNSRSGSSNSGGSSSLSPAPDKLIYQLLADLTLSGDVDKVLNHLFFARDWSRSDKVDAVGLKVTVVQKFIYVCMYAGVVEV